ncbi:MAG: DUF2087 domain-containing protein, partial [Microbacteriaceae bacterium]|nr:DUF2087 domain-containing protein [Microbacteriaceae bacterium]
MNAPAAPLDRLALIVVKDAVALGLLSDAERALVLGLAWRAFPAERGLAEREVNEALKAQLGGALACLATDHVELRRWLVDGGWLVRDGYGREYRRVEPPALPEGARRIAQALSIIEPA